MKLTRVLIENVGVIRSLLIPCDGGIVIVQGRNGSGKTTVLRAIQSVFEGGHQPDLIGPHSEKATVELTFDTGWRFVRTWTAKKFELKGWSADGGRIDSPAKTLQALFDSDFSLNPTGLIDAAPKDRVAFLHRAMPLTFSAAEIAEATSEPASRFAGTLKIEELDRIRMGRYDSRRDANVEWDRLKKTREHMVSTLPDGDPLRFTWMETAEGIDGQAVAVPEPVNPLDEVRTLETKLLQARESLANATAGWAEEYRRQLGASKTEMEAEIDAIREKYAKRAEAARAVYEAEVADMRKPFDAYIERYAGELAAAQERAQQQAKLEGIRDSIRALDGQIKAAQERSIALDNAVKGLDDLKRRKLETLPIEGVEVREGQIYVNGLNFDTQLNTAKQYLLSTQIAALTMDEFPFLIVDNAEAMDEGNRREYIEGLRACGYQAVIAAVDDEKPLTVEVVA
jgi:DNA repair ATPase RecN